MLYQDNDESQRVFKETFVKGKKRLLTFWGGFKTSKINSTCLSQWYFCNFEMDGVAFANAEQAMMYQKAKLFNDRNQMKLIAKTTDPKAVKALGRGVIGFKQTVWAQHRFDIVQRVNREKFMQNEHLKQWLMGTGDAILIEASPFDQIWGVGLKSDDPRIEDPNQWRGSNLLGFALMNVREGFRKPVTPFTPPSN